VQVTLVQSRGGLDRELAANLNELIRHLSMRRQQMPNMPLKDLIKEHKILIPILRTGTAKQRKAEARKQAKELKRYVK
jgi:phage terminase Nu1 subunit (DNA packaging protein)